MAEATTSDSTNFLLETIDEISEISDACIENSTADMDKDVVETDISEKLTDITCSNLKLLQSIESTRSGDSALGSTDIKAKEGEYVCNPAISAENSENNKLMESVGEVCKEGEKEEINPFGYLERGDFSSEIFKIELSNLPNRFGIGQLKKKLIFLGLKPCKFKSVDNSRYAFVTFRSEEDREQAMTILEGHVWKNKPLKCKKAAANADPLQLKRKLEAQVSDKNERSKIARIDDSTADELSHADRLNNAVTPLWKTPYSEQLQIKEKNIVSVLRKISKEIEKNCSEEDKQWMKAQRKENQGLICKKNEVCPSPVIDGYRNKCEFTVGVSPSGVDKTVGFRFSGYKLGVLSVLEPAECTNIPLQMKLICKELQTFLQNSSSLASFNAADRSGYWQMATVRCSSSSRDVMLSVVLHPQNLSAEEIEKEKTGLRNHLKHLFTSSSQTSSDLTTNHEADEPLRLAALFLQLESDRKEINATPIYEHLAGAEFIEEKLLDMTFRISPAAFFQVNTPAAEVLYTRIGDWCSVTDKTVLIDVCCGTGTIGLTLAKRVKRVIGVEICTQAIQDARVNAQINGIENAEFHCGKAEDLLPALMYQIESNEDVVVVVDPPRAGLHADVIRAIRRSSFVKRLVYVSCKPTAATQNIVDLTRQASKRVLGQPFRLMEVTPVDLFPYTEHCELVLRLHRL